MTEKKFPAILMGFAGNFYQLSIRINCYATFRRSSTE